MSDNIKPKTYREAEDLLDSLQRAAGYCQGPESSRRHDERIQEVEKIRDKLREEEGIKPCWRCGRYHRYPPC